MLTKYSIFVIKFRTIFFLHFILTWQGKIVCFPNSVWGPVGPWSMGACGQLFSQLLKRSHRQRSYSCLLAIIVGMMIMITVMIMSVVMMVTMITKLKVGWTLPPAHTQIGYVDNEERSMQPWLLITSLLITTDDDNNESQNNENFASSHRRPAAPRPCPPYSHQRSSQLWEAPAANPPTPTATSIPALTPTKVLPCHGKRTPRPCCAKLCQNWANQESHFQGRPNFLGRNSNVWPELSFSHERRQ